MLSKSSTFQDVEDAGLEPAGADLQGGRDPENGQGHEFIIDLVDVFESSTHFLVFELCPNGELFDYHKQVCRRKGKENHEAGAAAVEYCHSKGIETSSHYSTKSSMSNLQILALLRY